MARHQAVKTFIIVVVIAAIVPAVLFGEARSVDGMSGGDWWRNTLLDFQTLIGGLLAIFAAWWTVDTMDRTDRAADRRHDELVRLQTRADRLIIERMLVKHLPTFRGLREVLLDVQISTVEVAKPEELRRARAEDLGTVRKAVIDVLRLLSDSKWIDGKTLFGGHLTSDLEALANQLQELEPSVSAAIGFRTAAEREERNDLIIGVHRRGWLEQEQQSRDLILSIPNQMEEVRQINSLVEWRLEELAALYRIDVT